MSSHNRKTVPASQAQPTPQPEKWGWVMANGNRSDWSNAAFAAARNVSTMHMSAVRPVNFLTADPQAEAEDLLASFVYAAQYVDEYRNPYSVFVYLAPDASEAEEAFVNQLVDYYRTKHPTKVTVQIVR